MSPVVGGGRAKRTFAAFTQNSALSSALRPQLLETLLIWRVGPKFRLKERMDDRE
jgi:hypothetical protein